MIAVDTKQSTNLSGHVAVVYGQPYVVLRSLADSAHAALLGEHSLVFVKRGDRSRDVRRLLAYSSYQLVFNLLLLTRDVDAILARATCRVPRPLLFVVSSLVGLAVSLHRSKAAGFAARFKSILTTRVFVEVGCGLKRATVAAELFGYNGFGHGKTLLDRVKLWPGSFAGSTAGGPFLFYRKSNDFGRLFNAPFVCFGLS